MKKLGVALAIAIASVGAAHAADLPTKKVAPTPPPNCFASFWTWLDSTASDCPLSAGPITVYGTIDVGGGYYSSGAARNPSADKMAYAIQKYSNVSRWQGNYNSLSTSVIGIKLKQDLGFLGAPGWSLIGVLEAGVSPYSGMFNNGPRSLADNNLNFTNKAPFSSTALDSSRAGQWDNSQGYIGISNKTYGTLTFGRTNTLVSDGLSAYDPVNSIAYSLIGVSSSFPGFGNTETIRPNLAVTYRLTYQNFRAAFQAGGFGGYGLGNAMDASYQGQLGGDFPLFGNTPWAGTLSLDGYGSFVKDAVSLSSFAGGNTVCVHSEGCFISVNNQFFNPNDVLKATLSNNIGFAALGKYKWNQWGFYGGYLYARLMNPSDDHLNGFETIAEGIFVPGGFFSKGVFTNNAITVNQYNVQRVLQTYWTGARYAVRPDLDVAFGYYFQSQNNFNTTVCTGFGPIISSSKCAGGQQGVSALIDWRPWKRVDLYAGVMRNSVFGGLANGFNHTVNWDPSAGIRVRF
ncbi:MAG TPA: porin [Roseiarcus sp.]